MLKSGFTTTLDFSVTNMTAVLTADNKITVTADSGFVIEALSYGDGFDGFTKVTIPTPVKTVLVTITSDWVGLTVEFNGKAIVEVVAGTVLGNNKIVGSNVTASLVGNTKIKFNADMGFLIGSAFEVIDQNDSNNKTAVDLSAVGLNEYEFTLPSALINKTIDYRIQGFNTVLGASNLDHVTGSIIARVTNGAIETVFNFIAETGYTFNSDLVINFGFDGAVTTPANGLKTVELVRDEQPSKSGYDPTLTASKDVIKPPIGVNNTFLNVYSVVDAELSKFMQITIPEHTQVDYKTNTFLLDSFIMPFDLTGLENAEEKIKIGWKSVEALGKPLNSPYLDVNIGTIDVLPVYNNSYDIENVTCVLKLPFFNTLESLDPALVIGFKIDIKYRIDLFSGNTLIYINSTFSGETIKLIETNISYKFPIILGGGKSTVGSFNSEFYVLSDFLQASIEVIRFKPYNLLGVKNGRDMRKNGVVSSFNGLIVGKELKLKVGDFTHEELDEVRQLFYQGVIV